MSSKIDPWSTRFPALFRAAYVDYADCLIRYTTEVAPEELVSRLHLVAVTTQGRSSSAAASKGGDSFLVEPESRASH